jgi:formate dehydrogenase iron-sulfur subunit
MSRMLIDTSKCIGCKACQIACQQWHSLPAEDTAFTGSYSNPPQLSGANLNVVQFSERPAQYGFVNWFFFINRCRHCEIPHCQACPLGAVSKSAGGVVLIDPLKCDPHRCSTNPVKPCQFYCPYNVPKNTYVPFGGGTLVETVMKKCDFCYDRYGNTALPVGAHRNSRIPACQLACPTGAIAVGGNAQVLTYATNRVTRLRSQGYPNASVYPTQNWTWGPTHMVWILLDHPSNYDPPLPYQ